jgi:tocopherol O-methyltransferase
VRAEDLSRSVRRSWGHGAVRVAGKIATDRRYRHYLFDARSRNRVFLASVFRIWAAYRLGAMRYLLFTARRPEDGSELTPTRCTAAPRSRGR